MTFLSNSFGLNERETAEFGVQRARDAAFDAIRQLWLKRKDEGLKQKDLATRIGRDAGWVSTCLRGPANWTIKTLGELAVGLDGEIEIRVVPAEDVDARRTNWDAYLEFDAREVVRTRTESTGGEADVLELPRTYDFTLSVATANGSPL